MRDQIFAIKTMRQLADYLNEKGSENYKDDFVDINLACAHNGWRDLTQRSRKDFAYDTDTLELLCLCNEGGYRVVEDEFYDYLFDPFEENEKIKLSPNQLLYIRLKEAMLKNPSVVTNMAVSQRNTKCDACGKAYDYRRAPIVKDNYWDDIRDYHGVSIRACLCANCMEKALESFSDYEVGDTKFKPYHLKCGAMMTLNYLYCNDLDVDDSPETKESLEEAIEAAKNYTLTR